MDWPRILFHPLFPSSDTHLIWSQSRWHPRVLLQGTPTVIVRLRVSLLQLQLLVVLVSSKGHHLLLLLHMSHTLALHPHEATALAPVETRWLRGHMWGRRRSGRVGGGSRTPLVEVMVVVDVLVSGRVHRVVGRTLKRLLLVLWLAQEQRVEGRSLVGLWKRGLRGVHGRR